MRRSVQVIYMMGVALSLIGCGATRAPRTVIAPSYSYVKADTPAADVSVRQTTTDTHAMASADNKLPPIPAAPGFDAKTYVLVPTDPIAPFAD